MKTANDTRAILDKLEAQHPGPLGRTKADREDRPERDRHLAEDVARLALADDALDLAELDGLDAALEHGE